MVSSEMKMRVAHNCHEYRPRNEFRLMNSITFGSESCSSCINYVSEKCTKGLFDEIREIISLN